LYLTDNGKSNNNRLNSLPTTDKTMQRTKSQSQISSVQFFLLYMLCTFSPMMVYLPHLMVGAAGNVAWIAPIVGGIVCVLLFCCMCRLLKSGKGMYQLTESILGRVCGNIIAVLVMLWAILLCSYFVRHFAERVLLVYLSDAHVYFVLLSMMAVVTVALLGGLLSYTRLCEIIFYIFVAVFLFVTVVAMLDGIQPLNLLPISLSDGLPILHASVYMAIPFGIGVIMSFFADRVNLSHSVLAQSVKSTGIITMATVAVLVLTIGQLGAWGVQYLQIPYFAITRQIDMFGPLKNVGAMVFSMWILADFAVIATLAYASASIGQRVLKIRHKKLPTYIIVAVVAVIACAWRNLSQLEWALAHIIVPVSIAVSLLPIVLWAVGAVRCKLSAHPSD
jgi:spore germination protein